MNYKYKVLLIGILFAVGSAIYVWPTDEKKIKENLTSLAEYCSSVNEEQVIGTMQKSALAAKLCTDPCTVNMKSFKIDREFSQKDMTDRLLMMKKRLPDTIFSFHDTLITIGGDSRAEVVTTLRINGKIVDDQFTDAYEISATAEKIEGNWRFSSFKVVEFMKK